MSLDVLSDINWLAVLVGGIVYFALGALWYSPLLFARRWQRAMGWDPERTPPQMSATTYVVPFLAYLVMAAAVGMIAAGLGSDNLTEGVVLGLVLGIGLLLMHTLIDATFDPNKPEPWTWFAINGAYHALGILIVAVIVSVWV